MALTSRGQSFLLEYTPDRFLISEPDQFSSRSLFRSHVPVCRSKLKDKHKVMRIQALEHAPISLTFKDQKLNPLKYVPYKTIELASISQAWPFKDQLQTNNVNTSKTLKTGVDRKFFAFMSILKCETLSHVHVSHELSTVKPVLSGHSKTDRTKVLKTNVSLMKVESIAECSIGAFCNSFDLH